MNRGNKKTLTTDTHDLDKQLWTQRYLTYQVPSAAGLTTTMISKSSTRSSGSLGSLPTNPQLRVTIDCYPLSPRLVPDLACFQDSPTYWS
jgi:hypothetical protein